MLDHLARALLLVRGRRLDATIPSEEIAIASFMRTLPEWMDNEAAGKVYALAFDDGWSAFHQRAKAVLALPKVKGREAEALDLARNGRLSAADIARRLAAREGKGTVVPFPVSAPR